MGLRNYHGNSLELSLDNGAMVNYFIPHLSTYDVHNKQDYFLAKHVSLFKIIDDLYI